MKLDKRRKYVKLLNYTVLFFRTYWYVWFFLFLAFLILWSSLLSPRKAPLSPLGITKVEEVKAEQPSEEYYKETPLKYLRYRGQQLGIDEYTITKFISVMKCESGLRADAINKNTNGTFDLGIAQINDVHGKKISRADRLDFIKNIDYAYKLFLDQGFGPWTCARKLGIK